MSGLLEKVVVQSSPTSVTDSFLSLVGLVSACSSVLAPSAGFSEILCDATANSAAFQLKTESATAEGPLSLTPSEVSNLIVQAEVESHPATSGGAQQNMHDELMDASGSLIVEDVTESGPSEMQRTPRDSGWIQVLAEILRTLQRQLVHY